MIKTDQKTTQIKSMLETLSVDGLIIWAQYLWEHLCLKNLISDVDKKYQQDVLSARLELLRDLWSYTGDVYARKAYGVTIPSWYRWSIGNYCSMKNVGKHSWLDNVEKKRHLKVYDERTYLN
jgi:hypothetical protein